MGESLQQELSPIKISSSRLAAPGSPRMRFHQGDFGGKATLIRGRGGRQICRAKWFSRSNFSVVPKRTGLSVIVAYKSLGASQVI